MLETTETLIKGLTENNQNRWARFYRDYAPWIANVLHDTLDISHADTEDVIHETLVELATRMASYKYDKQGKGAFHSYIFKIAQNKAIDLLRKNSRYAARLEKLKDQPFVVTEDDWRKETFNMALRRIFSDPSILESTKIAFRRYVQLNEPAETVACELNMDVNALYQIKDRMKKRIREEVENIQNNSPDVV